MFCMMSHSFIMLLCIDKILLEDVGQSMKQVLEIPNASDFNHVKYLEGRGMFFAIIILSLFRHWFYRYH